MNDKPDQKDAERERRNHQYLADFLERIERVDPSRGVMDGSYKTRNRRVMGAAAIARNCGMRVGAEWPTEGDGRPIVCIQLPTGQVSWHVAPDEKHRSRYVPSWNIQVTELPLWGDGFDGHTGPDKSARIAAYVRAVAQGFPA